MDQPPLEMRPPGSVAIKDYAIETPLKKLSSASERDTLHEVTIDFSPNSEIAAIRFVLKDEDYGAWYQHRGGILKFFLWITFVRGLWDSCSNMLLKAEGSHPKGQDSSSVSGDLITGFYEEHSIVKEVPVDNSVNVSVKKCPETARNLLYLETDLIGDVVVHWGVCRDDSKTWEIPAAPHPPETKLFKKKALRTLLQETKKLLRYLVLQSKEDGHGSWGLFTLDEELEGFLFVLKLNENTWLRCMGNDFYIPLSGSSSLPAQSRQGQSEGWGKSERVVSVPTEISGKTAGENEIVSDAAYTDGIINDIRNLVSDISSEKRQKTKTKQAQESILQEIEKLAAEAYRTGSGFEILCQGFNWESNKSGRWYMELSKKVAELSSLGFTVVWLPPPTASVSPEGYMPTDLYNLNSRYGSSDELKVLVKSFHEVGVKVLEMLF
ncbi:Alpha-amylase 3, chloroplastic [Vitis vinifera]|uniref:1,4-alpha-D-glucan glucanohydrolase n=1 Tax=Vitis vinifera TaxID=29760 RepID=A0A438GD12_VITVI|nr:Alpha-amylase 3, chloroplastic [Vitis vinifera]